MGCINLGLRASQSLAAQGNSWPWDQLYSSSSLSMDRVQSTLCQQQGFIFTLLITFALFSFQWLLVQSCKEPRIQEHILKLRSQSGVGLLLIVFIKGFVSS